MGRLSLVIADTDEAYVESIVDYLMINHSQRFQVSSFTKREFLYEFLSGNTKKIDILLISNDLFSESLPKENITSIVLLVAGKLPQEIEGTSSVSKYQHGDKLVGNIVSIFSEKTENPVVKAQGDKKTKVIAVYSPTGGSGKTTIAVCSSIQCARRGLGVFYLNLENLQSTPLFFNCSSDQNLSGILYFLKEKNKNLHLRIEGSRLVDAEHDVHYFSPPESIFDMEEAEPQELKTLIDELRTMSQYDIVFVDMSSDLNSRNIALLEACDEIILVLSQDAVSEVKADVFIKQLNIINHRKELNLSDKMTVVLNRYNSHMALEVETVSINGKSISGYIPLVPGMTAIKGSAQFVDINSEFGRSIQDIINRYIYL